MKKYFSCFLFLIGLLVFAPGAMADDAQSTTGKTQTAGKTTVAKWENWNAVQTHVTKHVKFPATKAEMVAACENFKDVSTTDKATFETMLPDAKYKNAGDVIAALQKAPK